MLIVCPSCASRYSIDDDKIGEQGRMVRCASCRHDFFVVPPAPEPKAPEPKAPEPEPPPAPAPRPAATPRELQRKADVDLAAAWLAEAGLEPEPEPDDAAASGAAPQERPDGLADAASGASPLPRDLDEGIDRHDASDAETDMGEAPAAGAPTAAPAPGRSGPRGFLARLMPARKGKAAKSAMRASGRAGAQARPRSPLKPSAKAGAGRAAMGRSRGPLTLAAAGIIAIAALVWQREHVVSLAPASATLFAAAGLGVNLDGLTIDEVRSTLQREGEARFLLVEGRVVSVSEEPVRVPLIEVRVRSADRQTLYTWTTEPPRSTLRPGETLHFRTRLATPPEAGRAVEVRFGHRGESAAARN